MMIWLRFWDTDLVCSLIVFLRRCHPTTTHSGRCCSALVQLFIRWSPRISPSAKHPACVRCVHYVMNGSCKNICPVLPKSAHLWSRLTRAGSAQGAGRHGLIMTNAGLLSQKCPDLTPKYLSATFKIYFVHWFTEQTHLDNTSRYNRAIITKCES